MEQEQQQHVWRLWVDTKQRIVPFHPVDGFQLLEFYDQPLFFHCMKEYTNPKYRYQ